jgi:hypothetical protein
MGVVNIVDEFIMGFDKEKNRVIESSQFREFWFISEPNELDSDMPSSFRGNHVRKNGEDAI